MPALGLLIFLIVVITLTVNTISTIVKYIRTKENKYLKKLMAIWVIPLILIGLAFYAHFPITKDRVVGTYKIDNDFYPGKNANWQKELFYFEIKENDQFLFYEKLEDGSYKTVEGKVEWYRSTSPMLFRIILAEPHPLIDTLPVLYRGNRKFYYVFESKFGNMFYRKVK